MKYANRMLTALLALLVAAAPAYAQSPPQNPAMTYGMVPTVGQWNSWFQQKQDALGYTPLSLNGGSMLGKLYTLPSASGAAGLNMGVGVAPSFPANGDVWMTSAGVYAEVAGVTVGPFGAGGGGGSGTVNSGTAGNVAYYAGTGTTVSGEGLSALLDTSFSSAQGTVLYRGASGWSGLAPGTSGQFFQTQGASANPTWAAASGGSGCSTGGSSGNPLVSNGIGGCTTVTTNSMVNGALTLGSSGVAGSVTMGNATSGTLKLQPTTGALGTVTQTFQAVTDTVVDLTTADTLTNKTMSGASNTFTNIALSSHATQAANTVVGNYTSGAAAPTAGSVPSCSTSASSVNYTTNTGWGCNTSINAAQLGGATFASPGAIGGTTPGSVASTTLSASTSITDSALSVAGMVTNTSGGLLGTVAYATAGDVQTGTNTTKPVTASALAGAAALQTLTYGATTSWNMQSGFNATVTMTGNISTLTITNPVAGQTYVLLLVQDGTGSRTVTWPASVDWGTAGTPTLTTVASKTDMVTLICVNTSGPSFYATIAKGF